jgi:hypothetical protein
MSCPYGPCDLRLSSDNPTAVAGRVLCGGPAEQNTGGCGVSRNIIKFIKSINTLRLLQPRLRRDAPPEGVVTVAAIVFGGSGRGHMTVTHIAYSTARSPGISPGERRVVDGVRHYPKQKRGYWEEECPTQPISSPT